MAHKTITVSEEAYEALAEAKAGKESFTDVILRILKKRQEGTLLDYVKASSLTRNSREHLRTPSKNETESH